MCDTVNGSKQPTVHTETKHGSSREKGMCSSETSVYRSSAEESVRYKIDESSVCKDSDECFEYSCDPCITAGDYADAKGFCTNCGDYLCGTCLKSHSRSKASQHHTLLDKDNMPKRFKFCDPCRRAGDEEEAEGYCTDCGEYLCSSCFRGHSRSRTSRQHVLLDKANMPGWTDTALTSSVAGMNISGRDGDSQQYIKEYSYIRDINVKASSDRKDCHIVSMTLVTSTELILADYFNESLKLVDLENNVIKHSMRLQTVPRGLTTISHDQVAVVLYDTCKIQIISVSGGLSVVRALHTDGKCVDIKYINGKLYVSFWQPVKFQILQLTGAIFRTINPDSEVLRHCTLPRHIAVSPDESMVYVSDWKTNNVMRIDMNGRMISMYQGELDMPCDISISASGSVYLCNREQQVVYKMTPDLSDVFVILGRRDGLVSPDAMCFNADKQHLYVSSCSREERYKNALTVFKCS